MERNKATSEVRERVLATADRLFYRNGVRAVGIDRIIAEAEVAKMSLYKYFRSKDDLILAVLQYREEKILEFFAKGMEREEKRTGDKLRAFFVVLKELCGSPGFRGCPFQNTAVELADATHAATVYAKGHKNRFQEFLAGLVEESLGKESAKVSLAVGLLVEGAIVTTVIQGSPEAVDVARDAALQLVARAKGV